MKIICYKSDNVTATLKTVRNCTLLCTAYGVDVYSVPAKKDERLTDYYYHIGGTKDLLDWLNISSWILLDEVNNLFLNEFTKEQIRTYAPDAKTKIERIKAALAEKRWTSNGDALFCELVGELETAEQVLQNRAEYKERQRLAELEESKKREEEKRAKEQERERRRIEYIEAIKRLILSEDYISAKEFELIAAECKISLPLKLVGWLRAHCGRIRIQKHDCELPAGLKWQYKYATSYTYAKKGHTSKSIYKYADMIAEYLRL